MDPRMGDDYRRWQDEVVAALRKADNDELKEHRRVVREIVSMLKSLDKDLQSLSSYNTEDVNMTMSFNDPLLDEQQKAKAANDAAQALLEMRSAIGSSSLLTRIKTQE